MLKNITCLLLASVFTCLGSALKSQTPVVLPEGEYQLYEYEVIYEEPLMEESGAEMTPAELQGIVEEILEQKRRRNQRRAAYAAQSAAPAGFQQALNDQDLRSKMNELQLQLTQLNERLAQGTLPEDFNQDQTEALRKKDLVLLQTHLTIEMDKVKRAIIAQSLVPPVLEKTDGDSTAQQRYVDYVGQMAALREAIDSMNQQLPGLMDKNDLVGLEKQLMALEQKIGTAGQPAPTAGIATATEVDTTAAADKTTGQPATAVPQPKQATPPAASTPQPEWASRLEKEVGSMRQLVAEIREKQEHSTEPAKPAKEKSTTAPAVTPTPGQPDWAARLERDMERMQKQMTELSKNQSAVQQPTTAQQPSTASPVPVQPGQPDWATRMEQEMAKTQKMMTELRRQPGTAQQPAAPTTGQPDWVKEMQLQLTALQGQLNNLKTDEKSESMSDSAYLRLKQVIAGKEHQQLFFENNSFQLTSAHTVVLDQLVDLMQQYGKLDVTLIGFTSDTGSPEYNLNLSGYRTEAVKKYFMQKGIHPARVFTQFHGVDYGVQEKDMGRRVDVTMMINK